MHAQQFTFGNQSPTWSCDFLFIPNLPFLTNISLPGVQLFSRRCVSVIPKESYSLNIQMFLLCSVCREPQSQEIQQFNPDTKFTQPQLTSHCVMTQKCKQQFYYHVPFTRKQLHKHAETNGNIKRSNLYFLFAILINTALHTFSSLN